MDKKVTGILAYLGSLWLISFLAGDKEGAKFHLNQGLVLLIAWVVSMVLSMMSIFVPLISILSGILGLAIFIFAILGIVSVCNNQEKELPLIGQIKILK